MGPSLSQVIMLPELSFELIQIPGHSFHTRKSDQASLRTKCSLSGPGLSQVIPRATSTKTISDILAKPIIPGPPKGMLMEGKERQISRMKAHAVIRSASRISAIVHSLSDLAITSAGGEEQV